MKQYAIGIVVGIVVTLAVEAAWLTWELMNWPGH